MMKMRFLSVLCVGMLLAISVCNVSAQEVKVFKNQLAQEQKKYRQSEVCEKTVGNGLNNLNNLIWQNPDDETAVKRKKIVESCKFIKNNRMGCPTKETLTLLTNIQNAYDLAGNQDSTSQDMVPATNGFVDTALHSVEDSLPSTITASTNESDKSTHPYGLYGVIGLLLLSTAWLMYRSFTQKPTTILQNIQPPNDFTQMKNELLAQLGDDNLIAILKEMREEMGKLSRKIGELESEVDALKQQSVQSATARETVVVSSPVSDSFKVKELPKEDSTVLQWDMEKSAGDVPPTPENKRFALYMDSSEGFSVSNLMYSESADTIYEIAIKSNQSAVYTINNHPEAQAYALSDPGYYLRTACDFDNSPASGKHIETLVPGQLENVGNIWKITKRARIRFV